MYSTSTKAVTKTVEVEGTPFAYREVGPTTGVPVVFLHHFTAVLDDWDPAVVDGIAAERRVILVDLRGVGGSGGTTPDSVEAMAGDALAFGEALGLSTVDLLGYSLGGMVAQVIVQQRPDLVRRVILAGTAPAGDEGPAATGAILQAALEKAGAQGKHPKHFLFFSPTATSQAAADAFLARLDERTEDRDGPGTWPPRPCTPTSRWLRCWRPPRPRRNAAAVRPRRRWPWNVRPNSAPTPRTRLAGW
jgi:pimeloyl-ACP methyl ester carboxylesterase